MKPNATLHRRTALLLSALLLAAAPSFAQTVFRVTAIPDESPTELSRKAAPLMKYLEARLGMKVEFTPVSDYAAAVEALASRKVDLAWFGGFTFVREISLAITPPSASRGRSATGRGLRSRSMSRSGSGSRS